MIVGGVCCYGATKLISTTEVGAELTLVGASANVGFGAVSGGTLGARKCLLRLTGTQKPTVRSRSNFGDSFRSENPLSAAEALAINIDRGFLANAINTSHQHRLSSHLS